MINISTHKRADADAFDPVNDYSFIWYVADTLGSMKLNNYGFVMNLANLAASFGYMSSSM